MRLLLGVLLAIPISAPLSAATVDGANIDVTSPASSAIARRTAGRHPYQLIAAIVGATARTSPTPPEARTERQASALAQPSNERVS